MGHRRGGKTVTGFPGWPLGSSPEQDTHLSAAVAPGPLPTATLERWRVGELALPPLPPQTKQWAHVLLGERVSACDRPESWYHRLCLLAVAPPWSQRREPPPVGAAHHPRQSPGQPFGKGPFWAQGAIYFGCWFSASRALGLKDVECFCPKKQRRGLGRVALTPRGALCLDLPSVPPSPPPGGGPRADPVFATGAQALTPECGVSCT